jgi:hypothetical protein
MINPGKCFCVILTDEFIAWLTKMNCCDYWKGIIAFVYL